MVNAVDTDRGFVEGKNGFGTHGSFQSFQDCQGANFRYGNTPYGVEKTSVILTCPSCTAQYFADDKAIGEHGRTVRCAACSHSWFVRPELSLEQELASADLTREKVERQRQADRSQDTNKAPHQAYREKEYAKKKNGSRMAALGAWAVTSAIFLGLGATAIVKRDDVVRFFPEASSAYAMAGLPVNRFGLEFSDITADRVFDGTTPVLNVTGRVLNVTDRVQPVPDIRVDLRNDAGHEVESLLVTPAQTSIMPGEEFSFSTSMNSPSLEAYDLAVSFVPPDDSLRLVADPDTHLDSHATEPEHHTEEHADPHATDGHDVPESHDGHETTEEHHGETEESIDHGHSDDHGGADPEHH